ncbi:DNA repair helicase RAD25 [Blastocladiella emersonii ATCC 22665]|nr:DNA repair helicase RAD25 [Blastocladiella emersonii ATCC 22665]
MSASKRARLEEPAGYGDGDYSFDPDDDFEDEFGLELHSDDELGGKPTGKSRKRTAGRGGAGADGDMIGARGGGDGEEGGVQDFTDLTLKKDHASRPLWINPMTNTIILEASSPIAEQAQDFLTTIAEPISRPTFIHEYKLTSSSLYAAISVGLEVDNIISVLDRFSKTEIPPRLVEDIRRQTASFGRVKLVLKQNRYFIESEDIATLQRLLKEPVIAAARIPPSAADAKAAEAKAKAAAQAAAAAAAAASAKALADAARGATDGDGDQVMGEAGNEDDDAATAAARAEDSGLIDMLMQREEEADVTDDVTIHSFEIYEKSIENVKERCVGIGYPILEEYDFRNDSKTPNLDISLKPTTQIRPYQEKALSKMFGNGRARSGIIVLPCGAGKTLVGITAAATMRKSTLVLCTSAVSVNQWKRQFLMWSELNKGQGEPPIAVFTSADKKWWSTPNGEDTPGILISTYNMVGHSKKLSKQSEVMMDRIRRTEWGFLLLDEVHVTPAKMFRRVVSDVKSHTKLGLTATLVREDGLIEDLNYLIGPKLYEANWMDLSAQGHIARVQCAEVWCDMTPEFFLEYMVTEPRRKQVLYAMNPNKFQACQFLIDFHERRGDKIIVFSDNVYALRSYAVAMGKPYIYGKTGQLEREQVLQAFQNDPRHSTIFLSKVGDTSIDLPEATCLIQISSHYGSRRQEAQRLGRILRAKRRNDEGFNAFFYSLVSKDTEEMHYSNRRQQFLVDQGYAFKVITKLAGIETHPGLKYTTPAEQRDLLITLKNTSLTDVLEDDAAAAAKERAKANGGAGGVAKSGGVTAVRRTGNLASHSGADNMSYLPSRR